MIFPVLHTNEPVQRRQNNASCANNSRAQCQNKTGKQEKMQLHVMQGEELGST